MKKYFFILSLVYLLIFTLSSCEPKPLKVNLEQAEAKLVVSSQVIPSDVMVVVISKSFGALDYVDDKDTNDNSNELLNQVLVSNAKVSITYEGVEEDLFPVPNVPGFYASINVPQKLNVDYELKVFDPETNLKVSASATMLGQIPFDTVSVSRGNGVDSINLFFKYAFSDPVDEMNWYMVNVYATSSDTTQSNSPFEKQTANQVTYLLSDLAFDGKVFMDEKTLFNWSSDTIVASISNISEGYFNYLSARKRGGNLISSMIGEPINYPTNVVGGYGFFTTHFPDIRILTLP